MKCSHCKNIVHNDSDLARVKSLLQGTAICSHCLILQNFDPKEFMIDFDKAIQIIKELEEKERKAK